MPVDPTITAEICRRLATGESLVAICRDEAMPAQSTVYLSLQQDEAFRTQYVEARDLQADTYADQIVEIADNPVLGTKTTTKPDGTVEVVEGDMIEHRRLQVDARKWVASKLRPKKYGDATLIKHADADGNNRMLDDVERVTRLASIFSEMADAAANC